MLLVNVLKSISIFLMTAQKDVLLKNYKKYKKV